MKTKKIVIIALIVVFIVLAVVGVFIYLEKKQDQALKNYIALINEHKYEELYEAISQESKSQISKEDFVKRNKNIYEGIDATKIEVEITGKSKNNGKTEITYNEKIPSSAGTIEFTNTAKLVREKMEYKIEWTSNLIFPELYDTYKVRVSTLQAKRGEILDRNGKKLAENGSISNIGIVPGKLGDNKEQSIAEISKLTGVSEEYINKELEKEYVQDDTFVPIKKVSENETELKDKLLEIPGIKIDSKEARVYPLGKEASHLIGYISSITDKELEENAGKGYSSESTIGKSGIELAYEETLRGIDGKEIYIEDEKGEKVKTLAIQQQKDGQDVKLTIDTTLQKQLYDQMQQDKGFFVVMEPKTGELLALVSTPAYDSNDFVLGITNEKWTELNNDTAKPLYNRFTQSYCPGSTFKPITAAIGLTTGKLTPETTFNYEGTSWQKDTTWGNDKITTLTEYSGPKNIRNALIHSDNIFFGQAAMQIGTQDFIEGLKKIGFDEEIPNFPLSLAKSQFSSTGTIENEKKLADSGYGQGNILVNPIHMASIYSSFANNGNMVQPYLLYKENAQAEYLKEGVYSEEAVNEVRNALIQVVENPEGTANDMRISGHTIAGKTGTAELKKSADDTESGTLGWFDCFTINEPSGNDLLIVSMVENVQNNTDGGSHYLIRKIRTLF